MAFATEIEIREWTWHDGRARHGCIATDRRTGIAVIVTSGKPQANQRLACERLQLLLANLPWEPE